MQSCVTKAKKWVTEDSGELHVEICLDDLQNEYAKGELKKNDPIVNHKMTITQLVNEMCLSKAKNMHYRIFMQAEPLGDDMTNDIKKEVITSKQDNKERVKLSPRSEQ